MAAYIASAHDYREYLQRWSCMLSEHRLHDFESELAMNPAGAGARLHLENSSTERRDAVRQELALVALAFSELDGHIEAFLQSSPRRAFDLESSDTEDCLRWMAEHLPLTPQQASFVGYQLAEFAVTAHARRNRSDYLRFHERFTHSSAILDESGSERARQILHVNPTRVWWRLVTPDSAPGQSAEAQEVLFYVAAGAVRYFAAEDDVMNLVRILIERAPCTLDTWVASSGHDGRSLRELAARLLHDGLLAVTA